MKGNACEVDPSARHPGGRRRRCRADRLLSEPGRRRRRRGRGAHQFRRAERNVREYEAALATAGVSAEQLQFQDSVPQLVLFQLANARQYAKVAESQGVTATEGEIDQVIAGQGGQEKFEQQMLQQAVAPSQAREFMRSQVR